MAGRVTGLFSGWVGDHTYEYYPSQWKGSVPKPIMIERIKVKLTLPEIKRIQLPKTRSKQFDVWDAIGIGLHHLRSKRGSVLTEAECIYEHEGMNLCMKCGWQRED